MPLPVFEVSSLLLLLTLGLLRYIHSLTATAVSLDS